MNFVMRKQSPVVYWMASIRKGKTSYDIVVKTIDDFGRLTTRIVVGCFGPLADAETAVMGMVERKKQFGFIFLPFTDETLPSHVRRWIESDATETFTKNLMEQMVNVAKQERYVVFRNIHSLERQFDEGVEYLAYDRGFTNTLEVLDRFGEPQTCHRDRFESIRKTELAEKMEDCKLV